MILAALLLSAAAQAAPALDPATFDRRCLLALGTLQSNPDAEVRRQSMSAALFYFGRVDATTPPAELQARLEEETIALQSLDAQALIQACGAFMSERGAVLSAIGQRMIERGRQESEGH